LARRFQVVIVGGGPVGAALAVDLGLKGVRCALVETNIGLSRIPKGQNLTHRTLEHFYFWGIADELRAARLMPRDYPIGEITGYGSLASEHWQAPAGRELVRSYYFQDNERLPQYQMEAVLREKLARLASIETHYGWSATTLEQDADGARVSIAEEGGTGRDVLEADYVAGCDGARSTVREQAGIARNGTDFDQRMVLVVFRSPELHRHLQRFPVRSTYRVMHPELNGYWQFFGRVDADETWFFHAPVPAGSGEDNFDFHGLMQRAAGFDFSCQFDHVGFWDLRVAVAEQYQAGRVFIAGDAAHSHPPYGGFGLNNGLEDAVNIGWKLAARLQGWGGDALLRSYGEERQPVIKEVAEEFIAARIAHDAAFLARYDPQRDRAAFERAWAARETDIGTRVQGYEPNYEASPIVAGPVAGVSGARGTHSLKARAGHHLAPSLLSSGRNVFEELGPGFTLLAFDADRGQVGGFAQLAKNAGVPLKVIRDSYAAQRTAYEQRLVLVRPDQFIAWAEDALPDDPTPLLEQIAGRTSR
jgi:2-polyprenyl-6-methoxyphenol hydroxylase-like FAD-dependent oxidoreductase